MADTEATIGRLAVMSAMKPVKTKVCMMKQPMTTWTGYARSTICAMVPMVGTIPPVTIDLCKR
jgi:hypothetical protein